MEKIFIRDKEVGTTYYMNVVFDNRISVNSTLSEYPTTEGTPMTDHSFLNAPSFDMQIAQSELNFGNNIYYESGGQQVNLTLQETKDLLFSWQNNATFLTVQTRNRQFDNVQLYGISWSDNNQTKNVFKPTLSFKEIRIASLQTYSLVDSAYANNKDKASYNIENDTGDNDGLDISDYLGSVGGGFLSGFLITPGGIGAKLIGGAVGGVVGFLSTLF